MLRSTKVQMLLVLVAGAAIGYAAASGKFSPWPRAEAAPPEGSQSETPASCCSDGLSKAQLLALADPKVKAAVANAQANGKKPNILFIMGDDIGI